MSYKSFRGNLILWWSMATALGWVLAHPLLRLLVIETIPLWSAVIVASFAAGSVIMCLLRRRAGREPGWPSIATNTMSSIAVATSLVLMHPASIAGVFQWPILRRHIAGSAWWLVANLFAVAIPALINKVVILDHFTIASNKNFDFALKFALNFFLIGLVLGLAQWFVLRRQVVAAGWWIAISSAGWMAGGIAYWGGSMAYELLIDYMNENTAVIFAHTVPNLIGGLICGMVSAVLLARLLESSNA